MGNNLTTTLILITLILFIFILNLKCRILTGNYDKNNLIIIYKWVLWIISVIILVTIIVFFSFSFVIVLVIIGIIFILLKIKELLLRNNLKTLEEFPIYVEPIEIKTNCDISNDGCKIADDSSCYICDGGIHNRHW